MDASGDRNATFLQRLKDRFRQNDPKFDFIGNVEKLLRMSSTKCRFRYPSTYRLSAVSLEGRENALEESWGCERLQPSRANQAGR
jgi:hypothetical protein